MNKYQWIKNMKIKSFKYDGKEVDKTKTIHNLGMSNNSNIIIEI